MARLRDREAARRHKANWRLRNPGVSASQNRKYREDNRGDIAARVALDRAEHPEKYARYDSVRYKNNKVSESIRNYRYRVDNAKKVLNTSLKRKYGLTLEGYESLFAAQSGLCAICGLPEPSGKKLAVDHCHATGKVRGLLCHLCNRSLGGFRDDEKLLESAISYLRRSR